MINAHERGNEACACRRCELRREPAVDVRVTGGGTVYLFHPLTDAARDWLEDNVGPDAPRLGDAVACEHRYAGELAQGMLADGLVVR